jgi:transposase-like protein
MSSRNPRRSFTAAQKAAILREHLVDKQQVSEICAKHGLQPSLFYYWLRQVIENLDKVVEAPRRVAPTRERELEGRVAYLEARLAKRDHVIAELSEEVVALKKPLGGT